jgi:hypothetical protein
MTFLLLLGALRRLSAVALDSALGVALLGCVLCIAEQTAGPVALAPGVVAPARRERRGPAKCDERRRLKAMLGADPR